WFLMECIRVSSHWFERWPAAYFYVPAPAPFTTGLYYLLLVTLATGWIFRSKQRRLAVAGLVLVTLIWCVRTVREVQTIRLTVLPLKGAAAIYVDAFGRANDLLI